MKAKIRRLRKLEVDQPITWSILIYRPEVIHEFKILDLSLFFLLLTSFIRDFYIDNFDRAIQIPFFDNTELSLVNIWPQSFIISIKLLNQEFGEMIMMFFMSSSFNSFIADCVIGQMHLVLDKLWALLVDE